MAKKRTNQGSTAKSRRSDYLARSYYLPRRLVAQLDALAAVTGKERSDVVEEAIRAYLKANRKKLQALLDEE